MVLCSWGVSPLGRFTGYSFPWGHPTQTFCVRPLHPSVGETSLSTHPLTSPPNRRLRRRAGLLPALLAPVARPFCRALSPPPQPPPDHSRPSSASTTVHSIVSGPILEAWALFLITALPSSLCRLWSLQREESLPRHPALASPAYGSRGPGTRRRPHQPAAQTKRRPRARGAPRSRGESAPSAALARRRGPRLCPHHRVCSPLGGRPGRAPRQAQGRGRPRRCGGTGPRLSAQRGGVDALVGPAPLA